MPHTYYPIYDYFTTQGADFLNKKVLDFGGNQGNLIKSSKGVINENNYTVLDVDKTPLNIGMQEFPNATWMHYDRFNPAYNKGGDKFLKPPITNTYDVIVANSVFTHTIIEEIDELVTHLYQSLNPNGSIWFTWCNIDHVPCFKFFETLRIKQFGSCDVLPNKNLAYLCDNKVLDEPTTQHEYFVSFFKEDYILKTLKELKPVNHKAFDPWPMDCIEIRKEIL